MYYCPMYRIHPMECTICQKDHNHHMSGEVSFKDGHNHSFETYTSEQIQDDGEHIHFFRGETTYEDGHTHRYCGYTGPAIYIEDGQHYHKYKARTSYDDKHFHDYEGKTFPAGNIIMV